MADLGGEEEKAEEETARELMEYREGYLSDMLCFICAMWTIRRLEGRVLELKKKKEEEKDRKRKRLVTSRVVSQVF